MFWASFEVIMNSENMTEKDIKQNTKKQESVSEQKFEFNTYFIYFFVVAIFVCMRIFTNVCNQYGVFSSLGVYGAYFLSVGLSIFTQVGILLVVPFLLLKKTNKMNFKQTCAHYGFKKISWKSLLLCLVLGVSVFLLNIYCSNFFNSIIQYLGYRPSSGGSSLIPATWWTLVLDLLCTAVLPAFCEEALHRGMLMRGMSSLGMKKSILVSGLLFGLLHLNIEQFFYATIIGFFLGYLAYGSGSIYPCIIVHFMNNALSVFLSFARKMKWPIGNVISTFVNFIFRNHILGIIIIFLLLILLLVLAFELTKCVFLDAFNQDFKRQQKQFATMAMRQQYFQSLENIKDGAMSDRPVFVTKEDGVFVDSKEFLEFVQANIQEIVSKAGDMIKPQKMPIKSKILLWGSVALGLIITIMTFIWGLL